MWKPIIRCGIFGGIVVFLWYTVAWMLLPFHEMAINKFTDQSELVTCVVKNTPKNGIYATVAPKDDQNPNARVPLIFLNIKKDMQIGDKIMQSVIIGLVLHIIAAGLITFLLLHIKSIRYWNRVVFVTLIGVTGAVLGFTSYWNWWDFPLLWTVLEMFDMVVGWFLGGLVIAKLVRN